MGWGYDNQDQPFLLAPIVNWWEQLNTLAIVRQIRDLEPDVVICTHFLPARLVSLMIARRQLQATLTVVATDYDFQGLWLSAPLSHFFVARGETAAHMEGLGVPADRISVTGIPVRAGLADPVDEYELAAPVTVLTSQEVREILLDLARKATRKKDFGPRSESND